jgi:putative Mg2+ transporter-C (MgtC) family protein
MDEITHLLDTLGMARLIPHAAALAFAYGLALPIGWDREREERSAGLRTFPLVALASCGFVQATESLIGTSPEAQARIIEGLITGIGFIGGGAIIKHGGAVQGTATAAGLWATGAIGAAVGPGELRRGRRDHRLHDLHLLGLVAPQAATAARRRSWTPSRPALRGRPQEMTDMSEPPIYRYDVTFEATQIEQGRSIVRLASDRRAPPPPQAPRSSSSPRGDDA